MSARCARNLLMILLAYFSAAPMAADFCVGRGSPQPATIQDAIAMTAANGPGHDTIRLDTITFNVPDTLLIQDQNVDILGGFEFCLPLAPTGQSIINGAGGQAASVIEVRRTGGASKTVRFDRITITGGGNDGHGGGIDVIDVNLGLRVELGPAMQIAQNTSANGGGISVVGARLLLNGSVIQNNIASSQGGGIYCRTGLLEVARDTSVRFNTAPNGGGYALRTLCDATFTGGSALSVSGNSAVVSGGGMLAAESSRIIVRRGDPAGGTPIGRSQGFQVQLNSAGERGAGIALIANGQLDAGGIVIANNTLRPSAGASVEALGAALYAGAGATVNIHADPRCLPGESCNLIRANVLDRNGALFNSAGAALAAMQANLIDINNVEISANRVQGGTSSASAIIALNLANAFLLERALLHDNGPSDASPAPHLLLLSDVPSVRMHYLTIADNQIVGTARSIARFIDVDTAAWRSSILAQPGVPALSTSAGLIASFDCLLANELSSLPAATRSVVGAPGFVDAGADNYRPSPGVLQVDYCDGPPPSAPETALRDLDLAPAPRDSITVDLYGAHELGAYESQQFLADPVYANGFE